MATSERGLVERLERMADLLIGSCNPSTRRTPETSPGNVAGIVREAAAALSAAEARAWQAIETAPIIYSMTEEIPTCLVYSPQFGVRTGRAWRYPGGDACGDAYGFHGEWGVTHWMPLPAPPAALTEGERDD